MATFPRWKRFCTNLFGFKMLFIINFVTDQLPVFVIQVSFFLPINFLQEELALTSPTSGGRSVGIVRLRTKGHGIWFSFFS
jgi:hypothetical protein